MPNYIYVDNSNVWIEGMRVSAVNCGIVPDFEFSFEHRLVDQSWRLDFGRLYEFCGGDKVGRAVLYGSRPPENDTLWSVARAKGFEVVVYDRNVQNREKKIDTKIATDITRDSFELMTPEQDEITLVAGDRDYVPVIESLVERRFRCDVVFWAHASVELKQVASRFIALDPHLDYLQLSM